MKTSLSPANPGADEQASLWAARLDGGALDADARRDLEAWLGQNPEHRQLLSQYCQLSADLEVMLAPVGSESGRAATPRQARGPELVERAPFAAGHTIPRSTGRRWLAAAVAIAAVVAVTLVLWRPAPAAQAIATAAATRQTVTLEDGTQVELNARTRLEFRNVGAERRVHLFEGEAFFSVSHDASRPFFVETPAGSVRVTGTKFNVRSESAADLEVIVAEGSVEMSTPPAAPGDGTEKIMLVAGNRGFARDGGRPKKEALTPDALAAALAWREGEIVLNDLTLQQALQRFGRFHGLRIEVSTAAAGLHPGGRMPLGNLDGFLENIQRPDVGLGVRVTRDAGLVRVRLLGEP